MTGEITKQGQVVPCVGTWIEMRQVALQSMKGAVVPCVGTWIEIGTVIVACALDIGRPLRGDVD